MAGVHVPQIEERSPIPQLLQQDAIRPHPKAGLEQFARADFGHTLPILGIEQPDAILMRDDELDGIFDADEPFMRWDRRNQGFG